MKKHQIVYVILLIILVILPVILNGIFTDLKNHVVEKELSYSQLLVYKAQSDLEKRIVRSKQLIGFITSFVEENIAGHSEMNKRLDYVITHLNQISPSIFKENQAYNSIIYVDKEGKQIKSTGVNGAYLENEDNNMKTDLFKDILSSKTEDVLVSQDEDNVYFYTSIQGEDGQFFGVVILSLPMTEFIQDLKAPEYQQKLMLIDTNGKSILQPTLTQQEFLDQFVNETLQEIGTRDSGYVELKEGNLLTFLPFTVGEKTWILLAGNKRDDIISYTSDLYKRIMVIVTLAMASIVGGAILWRISYRKTVEAEQLVLQNRQLEQLNAQLRQNQSALEEEHTVVEELNALLETKSDQYLKQKDTLQAIIDSIDAGIAMINIEQQTIFMNKAWRENLYLCDCEVTNLVMQLPGEQLIDAETLTQSMVSGCQNSDRLLEELKKLISDFESVYRTELKIDGPRKKYFHLNSIPCKAQNGQSLGRIYVHRDISHEKEVDRLKSELISTVSHELRTPMSSIMGFSELLLTRELPPERSRQYVEIIHSQADRLTKLISDFLDIQRMENGGQVFNKQRLDLEKVIEESLELFGKTSVKHDIEWVNDCQGRALIEYDKDKMFQVISNLLSNAIKYSPSGGKVIVRTGREGNFVKVAVTDKGLGIPEEEKDKLFTKFYRVENDDRREIGGTGLGLAICKEVVQAHGGEIWAESIYGKGSTFSFTIPLCEFYPERIGQNIQSGVQLTDKVILVVEDDQSLVKLIRDILKQDGFETHVTDNGEAALNLAKQNEYILIILDIGLIGDLTGWDVLKVLKQDLQTAQIPVIISSIYENKERAKGQDVRDYLVKPFKPEQLSILVHKVLEEDDRAAKMVVESNEHTEQIILKILQNEGIGVKKIKRNNDILTIVLDGGI